jgi:hypothetical protein
MLANGHDTNLTMGMFTCWVQVMHALGRMRHKPPPGWLQEFLDSAFSFLNDFSPEVRRGDHKHGGPVVHVSVQKGARGQAVRTEHISCTSAMAASVNVHSGVYPV